MNRARVAELHRQLAKIHEELADELSADDAAPAPPKSATARKTAPRAKPRLVRPEGENDDLSRAKAQRFLRNNGLAQVTR